MKVKRQAAQSPSLGRWKSQGLNARCYSKVEGSVCSSGFPEVDTHASIGGWADFMVTVFIVMIVYLF